MSFNYTHSLISGALSFEKYLAQFERAIEEADMENPQSRKLADYTRKNLQCMSKLYESIELTDELRRVTEESKQVMWLVLSETWCGDAAQLIPVFQAIAEYSEGIIDLRFLLRDQYPDLMDCHLTNGARSIPKIIVLDQGLNELTTWGPRPAPLQKLVMEWKAEAMPMEELVKKLMAWYEEDQTKTTQNELKNYIIEYSR